MAHSISQIRVNKHNAALLTVPAYLSSEEINISDMQFGWTKPLILTRQRITELRNVRVAKQLWHMRRNIFDLCKWHQLYRRVLGLVSTAWTVCLDHVWLRDDVITEDSPRGFSTQSLSRAETHVECRHESLKSYLLQIFLVNLHNYLSFHSVLDGLCSWCSVIK